LFKEGIRPAWEDPVNESGGKWVYALRDREALDDTWMNMVNGTFIHVHVHNGFCYFLRCLLSLGKPLTKMRGSVELSLVCEEQEIRLRFGQRIWTKQHKGHLGRFILSLGRMFMFNVSVFLSSMRLKQVMGIGGNQKLAFSIHKENKKRVGSKMKRYVLTLSF
jgi:hypothetical protein